MRSLPIIILGPPELISFKGKQWNLFFKQNNRKCNAVHGWEATLPRGSRAGHPLLGARVAELRGGGTRKGSVGKVKDCYRGRWHRTQPLCIAGFTLCISVLPWHGQSPHQSQAAGALDLRVQLQELCLKNLFSL